MGSDESDDIAGGVNQILDEMDEGKALFLVNLPKMKMDILQMLYYINHGLSRFLNYFCTCANLQKFLTKLFSQWIITIPFVGGSILQNIQHKLFLNAEVWQ